MSERRISTQRRLSLDMSTAMAEASPMPLTATATASEDATPSWGDADVTGTGTASQPGTIPGCCGAMKPKVPGASLDAALDGAGAARSDMGSMARAAAEMVPDSGSDADSVGRSPQTGDGGATRESAPQSACESAPAGADGDADAPRRRSRNSFVSESNEMATRGAGDSPPSSDDEYEVRTARSFGCTTHRTPISLDAPDHVHDAVPQVAERARRNSKEVVVPITSDNAQEAGTRSLSGTEIGAGASAPLVQGKSTTPP
jgi:hypothetical protein